MLQAKTSGQAVCQEFISDVKKKFEKNYFNVPFYAISGILYILMSTKITTITFNANFDYHISMYTKMTNVRITYFPI